LLARIDVCQQVVPADNAAFCVAKREATRLEPAILAIAPTDAVFEFVRQAGFNGVLPGGYHARQVGWMHRVSRAPLLQFFKRSPKILEHLAVDVLARAFGRHDRDETGNRFDDQPKAFFAGPEEQPIEIALWWIG
jgi:hypothetical protein